MELIVDADHPGTPECQWRQSGRLRRLAPLELGRPRRAVVVAPHPDDEVLGAGGLVRVLAGSGTAVRILAVTDGEASHPGAPAALAARRREESRTALHRLGAGAAEIVRLGLPDGRVGDDRDAVRRAVEQELHDADLVVAPWHRDGHPDHDACGVVAAEVAVATGVRHLSFLVWAWHWAAPGTGDIPWEDCRRLDLDPVTRARKRWAIRAYRSQVARSSGPTPGRPVLPGPVLRRLRRPSEVFVAERAG